MAIQFAYRNEARPPMRVVQLIGKAAEMEKSWKAANTKYEFTPMLYGQIPSSWRPQGLVDQIAEALPREPEGYFDPKGPKDVRELIVEDYEKEGVFGLDPDKEVLVTNGVLQALSLACKSLLNPGDQVIVFVPYYFYFPHQIVEQGAEIKLVPTRPENNFKPTPEELDAAITEKTKLCLINIPNNPYGYFFTENEYGALAPVFENNPDIFILADEVYYRTYPYGDQHLGILSAMPQLKDRIVVARSLSKAVAMASYRAGGAVGSPALIGEMQQWKGPNTWTNAPGSTLALKIALSNWEGFEHIVDDINGRLRKGLEYMKHRLQYMRFDVPETRAGIFLFPEIPNDLAAIIPDARPEIGVDTVGLSSSERLAWHLLTFGTSVVPGDDSGISNRFRVPFAMDIPQIESAMDNMQRGLRAIGWL